MTVNPEFSTVEANQKNPVRMGSQEPKHSQLPTRRSTRALRDKAAQR